MDRQAVGLQELEFADPVANALGHEQRTVPACIRQNHRELVSAEPGNDVGLARAGDEPVGMQAKRAGKPLMIHDREAHGAVLRVLDSEGAPERWVMHCFSGDAAFARACLDRGAYLSFAGTVTFKNAAPLRNALVVTPLGNERVLRARLADARFFWDHDRQVKLDAVVLHCVSDDQEAR